MNGTLTNARTIAGDLRITGWPLWALLIGFWTKSILHALTLAILAQAVYTHRLNVPRTGAAKEVNP